MTFGNGDRFDFGRDVPDIWEISATETPLRAKKPTGVWLERLDDLGGYRDFVMEITTAALARRIAAGEVRKL